jgi:hypothetical protein
MNRRAFLKKSGAAAILPLSPRGLFASPAFRRQRPTDAGWPSKEAWKHLSDTVGENLIPVEFPITACATEPSGADCKKLFGDLKNPYYIGDNPGLTQAAGLLGAEVVTADGKVRIANPCTNPDLFWALKGGGGGSFGVVSKLTLRVRELPEFAGGVNFTIKAASDVAFRRLIRQFVSFYRDQFLAPRRSKKEI